MILLYHNKRNEKKLIQKKLNNKSINIFLINYFTIAYNIQYILHNYLFNKKLSQISCNKF